MFAYNGSKMMPHTLNKKTDGEILYLLILNFMLVVIAELAT